MARFTCVGVFICIVCSCCPPFFFLKAVPARRQLIHKYQQIRGKKEEHEKRDGNRMRRTRNDGNNVREIPWHSHLLHDELFLETIERESAADAAAVDKMFRRVQIRLDLSTPDHVEEIKVKSRREFNVRQRYFDNGRKMYVENDAEKSNFISTFDVGSSGCSTPRSTDSQLCGTNCQRFGERLHQ